MTAHARLAPSSAHRWMNCPGSVRLTADVPHTTSEYAELGTAAHLLFETCMLLDDAPEAWLGKVLHAHTVDEDMVDAVGHACDWVRGYLAAHPSAEYHGEQRVNAGEMFGRDDVWGTSDTIIDNRAERELVVLDYKHGAGVYVEVVDNEQLLIYASGALAGFMMAQQENPFDFDPPWDTVTLVIVQPRVFGAGGPVRQQSMPIADLFAFNKRLLKATTATDAPDAPLVPGGHCRFCKASARCPALAEHAVSVAKQEFVSLEQHKAQGVVVPEKPLVQLGLDDFAWLLTQVPVIRAWCNAIESEAELRLLRGEELPGFKLVRGRASYNWNRSDLEIATELSEAGIADDEIYTRSLISPAQAASKLGGKRKGSIYTTRIAPLVSKSQPKLTIAPADDPREAVDPLRSAFTNLDEEELLG